MTILKGVIPAIATPVDRHLEPDLPRFLKLAEFLLANGADGLNVLGTTGEATSLSVEQRLAVMTALARAPLPRERMMVGCGAAALADAVRITQAAAELGFAGALLLPPFYYKGVADDGVVRYLDAIAGATESRPIPLYLYHFPALSGVPYGLPLLSRLLAAFGDRIVGLKDSSGDMPYARAAAALRPGFAVYPSNEACLIEARAGAFAGCISATANLNADLCAQAWRHGDAVALERAVAIRKLFEGLSLQAGVKGLLAHIHSDDEMARPLPPLSELPPDRLAAVTAGYDRIRAAA